ncbi:MAG TPA: hypothetical protein VEU33_12070, partial [Archangium sp.]|nr:hypothetical protein [Archangium sp.]
MQGNRWLVLGALALVMSITGCNCGGIDGLPDGGVTDDGGGNNKDDGGDVTPDGGGGTLPDGGRPPECLSAGAACSRAEDAGTGALCCSGACGTDGRCGEPDLC